MRSTPEDFVVEELPALTPDGEGEHDWLWVRKRGANTEWLATALARFAGVSARDVGYAGRKDRHALTTQAFTVYLPGRPSPDWSQLGLPGVTVLSQQRHRRKLKRGALKGNHFQLRLRQVSGAPAAFAAVLAQVQQRGVPNYFGEQRFGRGGDNLARAEMMFSGQRMRRQERELLISAARSAVFNAVLSARVAQASWDRGLAGEVWSLEGSRSWFGPEAETPELAARLAVADIHPSGPLWGRGALPSVDAAAQLEGEAVASLKTLRDGLERVGLTQDRRALRLMPQALQAEWEDDATLCLRFSLPPGTYATVVLRELVSAHSPSSMATPGANPPPE